MKVWLNKYGIWLGVAVLIATVAAVFLTKSDPLLSAWTFILGAVTMFLVKRANPDLGSNLGK